MLTKLYLAYGSNLNMKQMAHRCPTAKAVGTATLIGNRLLFRGGHDNAVATIEPKKDGSVPVMLWEIQRMKPSLTATKAGRFFTAKRVSRFG